MSWWQLGQMNIEYTAGVWRAVIALWAINVFRRKYEMEQVVVKLILIRSVR